MDFVCFLHLGSCSPPCGRPPAIVTLPLCAFCPSSLLSVWLELAVCLSWADNSQFFVLM